MPTIFIDSIPSKKGPERYKVRARPHKHDPVRRQKTRNFPTKAKAMAYKKSWMHNLRKAITASFLIT
ncbi:hypothetical protein C1S83_22995 [Vibrio parahaemolyticus]|nr:hypothetical protein C1S87_21650 [Vibrio parahaemolyticus]PMT84258.1 hypothetical protein C1S83_22995 [Vibrio parahaemolyticus]PMT86111.1 hypothetical protein C1T03_23035 [Vibrio parahaemolyticus]